MENDSLVLLTPPPEERLKQWLSEFYGKSVTIASRQLLRHRDLSFVERLWIPDGLPRSLIYKVVLPPWDVEQDLYERILAPSIANCGQLYLSAQHGNQTAMFMEDLGTHCLKSGASSDIAKQVGKELAKLHRSYTYRTDELHQAGFLQTFYPIDYEDLTAQMTLQLEGWKLIGTKQIADLRLLAGILAEKLAGQPISLVHGDLYAENLLFYESKLYIIDWSWFTHVGVPTLDLATLAMEHQKNDQLALYRAEIIEAYCFESGQELADVFEVLPAAETLSRLLFLHWLIKRRSLGILGTTVGPVDNLIAQVLDELSKRLTGIIG